MKRYPVLSITLSLITLLDYSSACEAAIPLVEITNKPSATQKIAINDTNLIFYTLRNNTAKRLPLSIHTTSSNLKTSTIGNTCGNYLPPNNQCIASLEFTGSSTAINKTIKISFYYNGRMPLTDEINYQVDANIACHLLPLESYQTAFCQTQYQRVLQFTDNVFNTHDTDVIQGQTLGGMFGIVQRSNLSNNVCYVSCGKRELNGNAPDENTLFELASVTKTFTASILGKKVYLGLDPFTAVSPYLPTGPWIGKTYTLNTNEQSVTFQQLATFSGGVCFSDAPGVNISDNITEQQSDFVTAINAIDPTLTTCNGGSDPNVDAVYSNSPLPTHNFYSNSSVGLVGQALMNIDGYTNMDLADFNGWMCEHILTPLNMTHTNACLPSQSASCPQTGSHCNAANWSSAEYASPYHVDGGHFQLGNPFPFVPWAPAGALRSNSADMVKYLLANLNLIDSNDPDVTNLLAGMNIAHNSNHYLPNTSPDPTLPNIGHQSPISGGQGYAWVAMPNSNNNAAIYGKIGGHTNFRSFVGFSLQKKYGVVILFNTGEVHTDGSLTKATPNSPSEIGTKMINATEN